MTDGTMEAITQKGEFQVDLRRFLGWFFDVRTGFGRRDWCLAGYTGFLAASLAAFVAALLARERGGAVPLWPLAALALAAVIAERQSVRLSPRAEISVTALPIVLAAVIYGPVAAICVSVVSLLPSFKAPYGRWLMWTSSRSLAAGVAGLIALQLNSTSHVFGRVLAVVATATVIEQIGDLVLASVAAMLRRMHLVDVVRVAGTLLLAVPLYVPMIALLVYTYREISPWSVALFLFPALVAQKLFLLYNDQRATAGELSRALARQEKAHLQFASTLVAALDADDQYTAGHSMAVAVYARDIARRLGLSEHDQQLAHLAGLVHDVGKIGLPDGLLEKSGPLGFEERLEMEQHAVIGEHILANVEDYAQIAKIVRHHHEWVDGTGYPDGLLSEEIPLVSRIIAVADAYNAMTSQRSYRDAMPSSVARIRLARGVNSQFDTAVVAAFEAVLAAADEDYRAGEGPDFRLGQSAVGVQAASPRRVLEVVASSGV